MLVVSRAYLRALHVPEDGLRAQQWDTIPSNLRDMLSLNFSSDGDLQNVQPGSGFDITHATTSEYRQIMNIMQFSTTTGSNGTYWSTY